MADRQPVRAQSSEQQKPDEHIEVRKSTDQVFEEALAHKPMESLDALLQQVLQQCMLMPNSAELAQFMVHVHAAIAVLPSLNKV